MTEKMNSFQEGKLNAESLASSVSLKSGFKEGIKKAKDGAIIWKTFGVLAAVFLVLFFVCSGIAKIIMGVIFGLLMLFILVTFCIGFIQRGNRKENKEIQEAGWQEKAFFQEDR